MPVFFIETSQPIEDNLIATCCTIENGPNSWWRFIRHIASYNVHVLYNVHSSKQEITRNFIDNFQKSRPTSTLAFSLHTSDIPPWKVGSRRIACQPGQV